MGVKITGLDKVLENLAKVQVNTRRAAEVQIDALSVDMENHAKNNRPWTDRTGNARRSIVGSSEFGKDNIIAAIAIGVDYGKYLELSNGGKFRILRPTVDNYRSQFKDRLRRILTL